MYLIKNKKAVLKYSFLIFSLITIASIIVYAGGVFANTHSSTVDVDPSIVAHGQNDQPFTATVTAGEGHTVHEFRVYESGEFTDLQCEDKDNWFGPFYGTNEFGYYCQWNAMDGFWILPGDSDTFDFTMDSPDTECCRVMRTEPRDLEHSWVPVFIDICVDKTDPETTKSFSPEGTYKIIEIPDNMDLEWIDTATIITLSATDDFPEKHDAGIKEIKWRNTIVSDHYCLDEYSGCQTATGKEEWNTKTNPGEGDFSIEIQKENESCHLLEFYAIDGVGNEEKINKNCFFVDKKPPIGEKTIGDPNIPCNGNKLELILENKDSGWQIISDNTKAILKYNGMGPEFEYSLKATGLQTDTRYSLIYYADFDPRFEIWGGNNPGALITTITTDSSGNIDTSGSTNLGMNLPSSPDWNINPDPDYCDNHNGFDDYDHCSGAKIWLILADDYDGNNKKVNKWNPTKWLFETDLITYTLAKSECDYWVRDHVTEIILDCTDQQPHPSGDEEVCYKISFDGEPDDLTCKYCSEFGGEMEDGWCCSNVSSETKYIFKFTEDSLHDLEYFCRDAVNKKSPIDKEWFRVDSQAPIIEKDIFGDYLGTCPPTNPSDECYVADDGTSGLDITVYDDPTYLDCVVGGVECYYELWWETSEQECVNSYGPYESGWCAIDDHYEFTTQAKITFTEDSTHKLIIHCKDALGNEVYDEELFLVDSTPPVTTKTYEGPYKADPICVERCEGNKECIIHEMCTQWITSDTEVSLTAEDEKVGQTYDNTIYWRNLYFPDNDEICQRSEPRPNGGIDECHPEYYMQFADPNQPWDTYINPFKKPQESCHVIEYYSVDALGNDELLNWQCVFVDNTPPVSHKEHGTPFETVNEKDYVTQNTVMKLWCEDQIPHPVGQNTLYWRYSKYTGEDWTGEVSYDPISGWYSATSDGPDDFVEVSFPNDCWHDLEYYCVDHLGNAEDPNVQYYVVDTVAPEITKTLDGPYVGECPPRPGTDDVCYVDTATTIIIDAYDPAPHPVDKVECAYTIYLWENEEWKNLKAVGFYDHAELSFDEESKHKLRVRCNDALGNQIIEEEIFYVDKTPPSIWKDYGAPFESYDFDDYWAKWINSSTSISAGVTDAGDHKSGINEVKYRTTRVDDEDCKYYYRDKRPETYDCNEVGGSGEWTQVDSEEFSEFEFNINEDSCHLIEIMATDNVDKCSLHKQWVYVDNQPPTPVKDVYEPKDKWTPGENGDAISNFYPEETAHCWDETENSIDCWKVTLDTEISMTCLDEGDHPVDNERICFNVELDGDDWTDYGEYSYCDRYGGTMEGEWCCLRETIENFYFLESSEHNLKFYCVDALGNTNEEVDEEKFKVEGNDFIIKLNKKWNLISVPVVLLNDDPEEVFKDMSCVDSIWAYDPSEEMCGDEWCVYTPGEAPDSLKIIPGYGYWVLVKEACVDSELVIGGSLLSPGRTPPTRDLLPGWNLIGYYGLSGEEGYYGPEGNGDEAYCSLYSLVNTNAMIPVKRWSSLYGYWETDRPQFEGYGMCDELDPGAGYWIHMPADMEQYAYAPSTGCPTAFWNLICGGP